MSLLRSTVCSLGLSLGTSLMLLASPAAFAQGSQHHHHKEHSHLAHCEHGHHDREACRREAGAARQKTPENPSTNFTENALRRCAAHKDRSSREACEERVRGQQTQSAGSVEEGGAIHVHNSVRVGPPAQP